MKKRPDRLGVLFSPRAGNRITWAIEAGATWACDNDCFQGLDASKFLKMLAKVIDSGHKPEWIACPDVVSNAYATLKLFDIWQPLLSSLGLPVAFVGQDGLTLDDCPWDRMACFFVGGSTNWKLYESPKFIEIAKLLGKWVHVGRVNSLKRIKRFAEYKIDSFDGTGFSAYGDKRIHLAVRWIDAALEKGLFA